MKGIIKLGKFDRKDILKALSMASRQIEIERGFSVTNTRVHKSKKVYSRKRSNIYL